MVKVIHLCYTLSERFNLLNMPTTKKRLNITLPKELDDELQFLAKRDEVPQATKALHLLKLAVEIEEDDIFNQMAEKRDTKDAKFISHDEAWS